MYLPPDDKYSESALQPIPKNCQDKEAYMNKEIKDVPNVMLTAYCKV